MSKQMTLGTGFERYSKTTRREKFLAEMDRIVPWGDLCTLVYCHNNIFTIRTGYGTVRFMWKPADVLSMTAEQKRTLETWIRARTTPQKIVLRSRICVLAGEGKSNNAIADQLGTSRPTVLLWRKRFKEAGPSVCLRTPHMV